MTRLATATGGGGLSCKRSAIFIDFRFEVEDKMDYYDELLSTKYWLAVRDKKRGGIGRCTVITRLVKSHFTVVTIAIFPYRTEKN